MDYPPFHSDSRRAELLHRAAADFFHFQNRGYPRKSALVWVGDRYGLTSEERLLLHRGVFDQKTALNRRSKRRVPADLAGRALAVDGHNVLITVESRIVRRSVLKANDGALRDIAGLSSSFRFSETGAAALDMIFRFLSEYRPRETLILFDAPMSHSGVVAEDCRRRLRSAGLRGESRTAPVPEREFPYDGCIVAGSDRAVIDESFEWFDLALATLDAYAPEPFEYDFSGLRMLIDGIAGCAKGFEI